MTFARSGRSPPPWLLALEHDPEKLGPDLIRVDIGFRKERDDESKRSHHALAM
jgi:hypothetical protein